ncbi:hypothetical protein HELRODRAFT_63456 [Helobdella robusta]|uniref:Transmembrane protein 60 n=1 Tax=Helobdella robusta TaxID=6412 RepID=T1FXG1_HELRO|nr:hypothetical protein HELRODRAFT_63456 [Helobdella robusta]ESO13227.1 hypothetical protein HELRODRAFT_63456 [Helobdella robusta]
MNFKAYFIWGCGLLFFLFVNLRLDEKVLWSWFVVFVPMWNMDAIIIFLPLFFFIKQRRRWKSHDLLKFAFYIVMVLLKVTAQLLICLRLEGYKIRSYYVMAPVWVCLSALSFDLATFLRAHWKMMAAAAENLACPALLTRS